MFLFWKGKKPRDTRMQFLVVVVGQACTLKCRDCGNFCPKAPADMRVYAFEDIRRSLQTIIDTMGGIVTVQVQGGEPFLCTYLDKLLLWMRDTGRIETITLTTNGTILPKPNVLHAMNKSKTIVSISDYGSLPQRKTKELEGLLTQHGIEHNVYEFATGEGAWIAMGGVNTRREDDEELVKKRLENCPYRGCMTLEKNLLGYCSRCTVAYRVQHFTPGEGDMLDLWDPVKLKKRLMRYCFEYRGIHVMEACHYCNPLGEHIRPAIQETP